VDDGGACEWGRGSGWGREVKRKYLTCLDDPNVLHILNPIGPFPLKYEV